MCVTNSKVFLFEKFNNKLRNSIMNETKKCVIEMITKGIRNGIAEIQMKMFLLCHESVLYL